MRRDSNLRCCGVRGEVVRDYLKDPTSWKKRLGYGQRWMVEALFSGFKRLFGEVVHAKRFEVMVKEIELKVWVYNLMLGLRDVQSFCDRHEGRKSWCEEIGKR